MTTEVPSTVLRVVRLTITAFVSYVLADWLLPDHYPAPVLAPLTALLVVQLSVYGTIKNSLLRVVAVTVGVLVAVLFAALLGFSAWTLGLAIAAALILGYLFRLGEHAVEVPISAMLIFALEATSSWGALDRVQETLIGAGTGLVASLLLPSVQVRPAAEAVESLGRRLSGILDEMARELRRGHRDGETRRWLTQVRQVSKEVYQCDDALETAEESIRLNTRAYRIIDAGVALRNGVETLEYAALAIRGLARALDDSVQRGGEDQILQRPEVRERLAATVSEISKSMTTFGRLARSDLAKDAKPVEAERELNRHINAAEKGRDRVAEVLRPKGVSNRQWPLYGEVLMHLDRVIGGLRAERRARARQHWQRHRAGRHLPEPQGRLIREAGDRLRKLAAAAAQGTAELSDISQKFRK